MDLYEAHTEYMFRQATIADLDELARIWHEGQMAAVGSALPLTEDDRDFFRHRIVEQDAIFQIWVADAEEPGRLLGYQSLLPMRNHPTLRRASAESGTYICQQARAKGLGEALIEFALKHARRVGLIYVFAFVSAKNAPVVHIAEKFGFITVGPVPRSGRDHGPDVLFLAYVVPET